MLQFTNFFLYIKRTIDLGLTQLEMEMNVNGGNKMDLRIMI